MPAGSATIPGLHHVARVESIDSSFSSCSNRGAGWLPRRAKLTDRAASGPAEVI